MCPVPPITTARIKANFAAGEISVKPLGRRDLERQTIGALTLSPVPEIKGGLPSRFPGERTRVSARRPQAVYKSMTALHLASLRGLRRTFRLESRRLLLPQGVRAVLAISVPIGLGLAFNQLAAAVIVTLGAWFVLITDTGGAYRQKATATLSATVGVAFAVFAASILNVSPFSRILGTFFWVAVAAFI